VGVDGPSTAPEKMRTGGPARPIGWRSVRSRRRGKRSVGCGERRTAGTGRRVGGHPRQILADPTRIGPIEPPDGPNCCRSVGRGPPDPTVGPRTPPNLTRAARGDRGRRICQTCSLTTDAAAAHPLNRLTWRVQPAESTGQVVVSRWITSSTRRGRGRVAVRPGGRSQVTVASDQIAGLTPRGRQFAGVCPRWTCSRPHPIPPPDPGTRELFCGCGRPSTVAIKR